MCSVFCWHFVNVSLFLFFFFFWKMSLYDLPSWDNAKSRTEPFVYRSETYRRLLMHRPVEIVTSFGGYFVCVRARRRHTYNSTLILIWFHVPSVYILPDYWCFACIVSSRTESQKRAQSTSACVFESHFDGTMGATTMPYRQILWRQPSGSGNGTSGTYNTNNIV